jgi:hypothetical protein
VWVHFSPQGVSHGSWATILAFALLINLVQFGLWVYFLFKQTKVFKKDQHGRYSLIERSATKSVVLVVSQIVGAIASATAMFAAFGFSQTDNDLRDRDDVKRTKMVYECVALINGWRSAECPNAIIEMPVFVENAESDTQGGICTVKATASQQYPDFVVIGYQGTKSLIDARLDMNLGCVDDTYCGTSTQMHEGFVDAFLSLEGQINSALSTHLEEWFGGDSTAQLFFTGHSLGGAIANIASYKHSCTNTDARLTPHLVTFGSPAVFTDVSALETQIPASRRVRAVARYEDRMWDDIVTLIPPGFSQPKDDVVLMRPEHPATYGEIAVHFEGYGLVLNDHNKTCAGLDNVCLTC